MKMTHFYKLTMATLLAGLALGAQAQTYCVPPPFSTGPFTGITNVEVGTLNNTSSANDGYVDYTSTLAAPELKSGQAYTLKVTTEHNLLNNGFSDKLNTRVWIDWNQDGDFDDQGEEVLTSDGDDPGLLSVEFTVPATAVSGETRMRVYEDMLVPDGHDPPNPCGYLNSSNFIGQHGECEDYVVNVTGGTASVSTLTSSDIVLDVYPNPTNGNATVSFNLPVKETVSVNIYDLQGRVVKNVSVIENAIGEQTVNLDLTGVEKGFYLVRVEGTTVSSTKKLLVN